MSAHGHVPIGHQGSSPNHTHHQLHPFSQSRAGLQLQPVPQRAAWALSLKRPWLPREGGHCVTSWKSGGGLPREGDQAPSPEPGYAECRVGERTGPAAWPRESVVVGSGLVGSELEGCFCFFGESASFRRRAKCDCGSPVEAAVGPSLQPSPPGPPGVHLRDGGARPAQDSAARAPTHPSLFTLPVPLP